jgi:hypothetical protein
MLRRGCILLAMLAMTVGTVLTASSASASPRITPGSVGGLHGFPDGFLPGGLMDLVGTHGVSHGVSSAQSTNWSGYAGTTGTYTSVSASWIQPAGHCTNRYGTYYAAFWVGLDGFSSGSVEQTGSEVDCNGRNARYYAWWEMYPGASVSFSNPVGAGDHFTASVTYIGNDQFTLTISDATRSWTQTTTQTLANAARSSAEVIAEAPCCTFYGGILPLTNFGTMTFTNSMVNTGSGPVPIGSAGGLTEITMVNNLGQPKDQISALTPAAPNGTTFSATWLRSQ